MWRADDFGDGAISAVNLAGDSDTTGAVYGQLAGALWGAGAIPSDWLDRLIDRPTIADLADRLAGPRMSGASSAVARGTPVRPPIPNAYVVAGTRLVAGE